MATLSPSQFVRELEALSPKSVKDMDAYIAELEKRLQGARAIRNVLDMFFMGPFPCKGFSTPDQPYVMSTGAELLEQSKKVRKKSPPITQSVGVK